MPSVFSALSPIRYSPPAQTTTFSAVAKENEAGKAARATRKPLGPRSPPSTSSPPSTLAGMPRRRTPTPMLRRADHVHGKEKDKDKDKRRSLVLRDVTSARQPGENIVSASRRADKDKENNKQRPSKVEKASSISTADTSKDSVRSRMKKWERARERLREMSRLEERMREVEEEREREHEEQHE